MIDIETWDVVREFVCGPIMQRFGRISMTEKLEIRKDIRLGKVTINRLMIESGVLKAKRKKNHTWVDRGGSAVES
jgi:predicted transcriptional regulator